MSVADVRPYDGAPNYIKGAPITKPKDGVKASLRGTVRAFKELGERALNAADYEATRHLPVGRGRLACDPETGEFDMDAARPIYNPALASPYPRHVHSTVTEDEFIVVWNIEEHKEALSTGKWAEKPLEKKRRFKLTEQDQLKNFEGQLLAERARGLELERLMTSIAASSKGVSTPPIQIIASEPTVPMAEFIKLQNQFESLMARVSGFMEAAQTAQATVSDDEDEDDQEADEPESESEEEVKPVVKRGKRS